MVLLLQTKEHNFPFIGINCPDNTNNGDIKEDMSDNSSTSNSPGDEYFSDADVEDLNQNYLFMVNNANSDFSNRGNEDLHGQRYLHFVG